LVEVMRSGASFLAGPIDDIAAAKVSKPVRNPGNNVSPARVNASGRGRRRKSLTPQ
jgi:hypothetical protein